MGGVWGRGCPKKIFEDTSTVAKAENVTLFLIAPVL